jgi:hypothetical protein
MLDTERVMVIFIDEFLQKLHKPDFRIARVAAPPRQVETKPDDDRSNDDPPGTCPPAA